MERRDEWFVIRKAEAWWRVQRSEVKQQPEGKIADALRQHCLDVRRLGGPRVELQPEDLGVWVGTRSPCDQAGKTAGRDSAANADLQAGEHRSQCFQPSRPASEAALAKVHT